MPSFVVSSSHRVPQLALLSICLITIGCEKSGERQGGEVSQPSAAGTTGQPATIGGVDIELKPHNLELVPKEIKLLPEERSRLKRKLLFERIGLDLTNNSPVGNLYDVDLLITCRDNTGGKVGAQATLQAEKWRLHQILSVNEGLLLGISLWKIKESDVDNTLAYDFLWNTIVIEGDAKTENGSKVKVRCEKTIDWQEEERKRGK